MLQQTKFKKIEKGTNPYLLSFIPENWNYIKLGDSGEFINGLNKEKEDYGHGCLHVNIDNIFEDFFIRINNLGRVNANENEIQRYSLRIGDICMLRSSVKLQGVGFPALFNSEIKPVVFSGFIIRFRPNFSIWNPKFLTYTLRSEFIRNYVIAFASISANININQESLRKIAVPNPPLKEQQRIASFLSNLDELIRKTSQIMEQTQKLKKGLMQKLLTKGIGHTKFKKTDVGRSPELWDIVKIGDLIKNKEGIKTGPFGSSLKKEIFVPHGYKIYGQENVIPDDFTIGNYYISEDLFLKMQKYEIIPGDILISLVGTHGKISLVPKGIERGIINPRLLRIRLDISKMLPQFMKILLESNLIQKQIQNLTHGLTMGIINTEVIKQLVFFVPTLLEQEKIIRIMNGINLLTKKQSAHKEYLLSLKKGLMQKLLTGKIRVKV